MCSQNQLATLDLSKNTALTYLICSKNQLTLLDLSGNAALITLGCSENQLTTLDASGKSRLSYINCIGNSLTALDVRGNTALETLECSKNLLEKEALLAIFRALSDRSTKESGYVFFEENPGYSQQQLSQSDIAIFGDKNWFFRGW